MNTFPISLNPPSLAGSINSGSPSYQAFRILQLSFIAAPIIAGTLIITNLLLIPGYFEIALRGIGLLLGALALGRLSKQFAVQSGC